jgi:hypothetical protein
VNYFQCSSCGFIQTETPYWLDEAYKYPINPEDTGLVNRNIVSAKRTSSLLYFLFDPHGTYLDYGGGYGLFVRLMRDSGFNFYWTDPFTKNIFAEGFEYDFKTQKKLEWKEFSPTNTKEDSEPRLPTLVEGRIRWPSLCDQISAGNKNEI